jgi:hypothetical protein
VKKLLWIIILLVILLLLFFFFRGCFTTPKNVGEIKLGPVGYSIWPDGSVAVAIPLINSGETSDSAVNVAKVTLGSGSLVLPTALPVALGEMNSDDRRVLQTQFSGLTAGVARTLTVSGTYVEAGVTHDFSASTVLDLTAPHNGPVGSITGVPIPKHVTTGVPTAPGPPIKEFEGNNEAGPGIPIGPTLHPFTVAPNLTAPQQAPAVGAPGSSVTIVKDQGGNQPANLEPPDPSTAVASTAGVVMDPANTYMLFSTTSGSAFTQYDPTTIFPQTDGGLCCDQVVIYDPNTDLFFWMMQYSSNSSGVNILRIAYQHPASLISNFNLWTYFDLSVATFNGQAALDYPDISVTNTYLYASVDGTDKNGNNSGLIVARMPLSDITGSSGSVGIGYFSPNEDSDEKYAWGSRLTQGSTDGMYWAGHTDTSHMEVFHWPDSSGDVTSNVTSINTFCNVNYTSLAPDNNQWIDATRAAGSGRVIAATRQPGSDQKHGKVWFGWGAAADDSSCKNSRPQPYVDITQVDDSTLNSVGEYDIWNTPYAFAYPSLGTAPNGDIGVAVSFGGSSNYASATIGYLGDYVVYYVDASTATLNFPLFNSNGTPKLNSSGQQITGTRYGDMFAVRQSGPRGVDFSSELYAYQYVNTATPSCSSAAGCQYRLDYVQFSR